MIYRYIDIVDTYGSAYQIDKAVEAGSLYKLARGVYSDERHPDPNSMICALYPQAVLTMDSAFYLHGLTDVVPDLIHVATPRNSTRIRDNRVRQYYMKAGFTDVGVQTINPDGALLRIFSKERLLVELLRSSSSLPLDYYKEIIGSYRKIALSLDMHAIEICMDLYKRADSLFSMLQREVL